LDVTLRAAQPVGYGNQFRAIVHVAGMQPATVVLERVDERPEIAPGREIRRSRRRLNLASIIDKNLQIVKATQKILSRFELPERSGGSEVLRFRRDFPRVSKLLHCDAHVMETLWHVDGTGGVDRRSNAGRAAAYQDIQRRQPDSTNVETAPGFSFGVFEIAGGAFETLRKLLQLRKGEFRGQPLPRNRSPFPDRDVQVF
jgi:hypothetical protein